VEMGPTYTSHNMANRSATDDDDAGGCRATCQAIKRLFAAPPSFGSSKGPCPGEF